MDNYNLHTENNDKYSLRGRVFHKIRDDILTGRYRQNEAMKELQISKELGVSRTPVREAGMAYVELGICGHGLSSPEFPSCVFGGKGGMWDEHGLAQIAPITLQENMVFGTNVDVHDPRWNADTGLMLGDTIVVTKDGPRKLSRIPIELTVV